MTPSDPGADPGTDPGARPGPAPQGQPEGPDDPIYRTILLVLVLSVLAGAALALVGELLYRSEAAGRAGTGIALVSALIYFVFRWLGRREARRKAASEEARGPNGAADREP
jgi:hypothetical protein